MNNCRLFTIPGVTASIEESVNWLKDHTAPDFIFMDIELADGQSFGIFSQVQIQSPVIFNTSYDKHVLPAFRSNSKRYLIVENNIRKKKTAIHSNQIGLQNIMLKYKLLDQAAVEVYSDDQKFIVNIPLITPKFGEPGKRASTNM